MVPTEATPPDPTPLVFNSGTFQGATVLTFWSRNYFFKYSTPYI